jgi:XTP/dITP diphosphohydrolase
MPRIVLASSNPGKHQEFADLLADSGLTIHTQTELGVADIAETGLSFIENALIKARHAARLTGLPALADDSGLCVDALQGAPGLYSARYADAHGDAQANNAKLLAALQTTPAEQRHAFFICVLVLVQHADDATPWVAEGRWHGQILPTPRGQGFGYDPLFLPAGQNCSAAELAVPLKNQLSHRGQALAQLRQHLTRLQVS